MVWNMVMQKPSSISNEEDWRFICDAIVETTQAILDGKKGIIEGARILSAYRRSAKAESDDDFLFFMALDSETDDLPIGNVRNHWNPEVLKEKDKEIIRCEALYRDQACIACKNLIAKYGQVLESERPLD